MPRKARTPDDEPEPVESVETPPEEQPVPDVAAEVEEWVSIRDSAKDEGIDLSSFEDDTAALKHLIERSNKAAEYEQQLAQYQQYLAQQQLQQQQHKPEPEPQVAPEKKYWNAPEFDPMWMKQIRTDETGKVVPIEGASTEVVDKLRRWAEYQQREQDKYWQNPFEYIKPFVDDIVSMRLNEHSQRFRGELTEEQKARDILAQNQDWLVTKGPNGPEFTPEGKVFNAAVQEFRDLPVDRQYRIAMLAVEKYRAEQAGREASLVKQHAERKKQSTQPQHQPSAGGTLADTVQNPGLPLDQLMAQALKEAGISEQDITANY